MRKNNWQKLKIDNSKHHQEEAYRLVNELVFTERKDRMLTLADGRTLIDFVSCSYLGLDLDPRIIKASTKNIEKCGVTFPAARTRIQAESFVILEKKLNKIFCDAHSVIFASLHLGHLGLLPLLGSGQLPSFPLRPKGCYFILDKTVHASIQINRALMQQFGSVVMIDFSNESALHHAFEQAKTQDQTPIALADSIGSMGGISPIMTLFSFAETYGGYVYLDDAHGMSIYGKNGCGYVLEILKNQFHPRLILTTSLAKAFGAIAGVMILPSADDIAMVKRYSATYIFGGPPALSMMDAAIASADIHLSGEIHQLQHALKRNLDLFDSLLSGTILNEKSPSPIRGLFIGDELMAIQQAKSLQNQGFAVTTAMYPTVKKGHAMLRFAISAKHTEAQITSVAEIIRTIEANQTQVSITSNHQF